MKPCRLSVVITCHNYGTLLPGCLESVLSQSLPPDEVIVVDDASNEDIQAIVDNYKSAGVRFLRVDYRHPIAARRAGFEISSGEILCFVDGDDQLGEDYFRNGLPCFASSPNIGIVYSDVEFFGEKTGTSSYPATSELADISELNFIHAGALVRRDAILLADAFNQGGPSDRYEDWSTWRRIFAVGFCALKQTSFYRYRKHAENISRNRHFGFDNYTYYQGAALSEETVTLFVPLAGRENFWERLKTFLENQEWNHRLVKLVLLDTSHNDSYSRTVREWIAGSDYSDIHYLKVAVGSEGLADHVRINVESGQGDQEVLAAVHLAMSRIYNHLRNVVSTNYLWVVEDDVIPPLDCCERLLRSFCPRTLSVTGAVRHRYENEGYVAWDSSGLLLGGQGVQQIEGNGFCCVMLRSRLIRSWVFGVDPKLPNYDQAFYKSLIGKGLVKIDWDIECEHLSEQFRRHPMRAPRYILLESAEGVTPENFDEHFYLERNPDVRAAVLNGEHSSGYEHFIKYGAKEKRAAVKLQ